MVGHDDPDLHARSEASASVRDDLRGDGRCQRDRRQRPNAREAETFSSRRRPCGCCRRTGTAAAERSTARWWRCSDSTSPSPRRRWRLTSPRRSSGTTGSRRPSTAEEQQRLRAIDPSALDAFAQGQRHSPGGGGRTARHLRVTTDWDQKRFPAASGSRRVRNHDECQTGKLGEAGARRRAAVAGGAGHAGERADLHDQSRASVLHRRLLLHGGV